MPAHRHAIVALNAASNYARFVAAAVATFWLTPHLVGSLGAENYGLWTLAISVAGYLELLDCGLAAATMRFVAARGSDSDNDKRALVSTLNWLALALGVIVLVLGGSVAAIWHGPLGTLILLVTLRVSCNVMLSVFMGALFGALIVGGFQSGLRMAGVDVLWQVFAIGWLIIIAVVYDSRESPDIVCGKIDERV